MTTQIARECDLSPARADEAVEMMRTFYNGYRFSRDGMAWLLRDFSDVTLYSIRGPYSSIFNLHRFWKKSVEKRFGMAPARWVDRIGKRLFDRPGSELQVSGYYAWARK